MWIFSIHDFFFPFPTTNLTKAEKQKAKTFLFYLLILLIVKRNRSDLFIKLLIFTKKYFSTEFLGLQCLKKILLTNILPHSSEVFGSCRKYDAIGLVVENGLERFSLNKFVSFDDSSASRVIPRDFQSVGFLAI